MRRLATLTVSPYTPRGVAEETYVSSMNLSYPACCTWHYVRKLNRIGQVWLVYPTPTLRVIYICYTMTTWNDNRRKSGLSPSGLRITDAIPAQGHETRSRTVKPNAPLYRTARTVALYVHTLFNVYLLFFLFLHHYHTLRHRQQHGQHFHPHFHELVLDSD